MAPRDLTQSQASASFIPTFPKLPICLANRGFRKSSEADDLKKNAREDPFLKELRSDWA